VFEPGSGEVYSIQHYVVEFVSDLRQVSGFLLVLRFPPPIKLTTTIYNWNIVESGVKHHKPNLIMTCYCTKHVFLMWFLWKAAVFFVNLWMFFFSILDPKCHVRYCHHLASIHLHFHLLLWNHWTNWELISRNVH
jgi:hypothetical protein